MLPLLHLAASLLALVALTGCATITGESTQKVSIQTVDAQGRSVDGMSCFASNSSAEYVGVSPMFDMKIRRSASPLIVECRRDGTALARAVLVSRAVNMAPLQLLLPGGTSMMALDHFSGFMYSYPRWVRVQVGTDMVFDRRDELARDPTPGLVTRQFDDYVRFASGNPARAE